MSKTIKIKNFLSLYPHPSDELLNWTDKQVDALKLREAWDKIPQDLWPHVKVLMEKVWINTELEQAEKDAGEGL